LFLRYSEEKLNACLDVLRTSTTYPAALARIGAEVDSGLDRTALGKLFKRAGLMAPSHYVTGVIKPPKPLPPEPRASGVDSFGGVARGGQRGNTTRIMVCPDAHHPCVDQLAWQTFLAALREWKPDRLIIIGDFADCLSVSFHPKDPARKVGLKDEIDAVNQAADEVEETGVPEVDYLEGNHELRLQRYLWEKASELYGLVSIKDLLRIDRRGWNWIPYRESLTVGKLHFAHDVGRCGKHTASQSLADYGHSIVMGHSHRAATIYNGTVAGERQVAMNVGTLIDIASVDYRHRAMAAREWQHGFGVIHMTSDGVGWCSFVPIIEGRCVVDGRVISGRKEAA
jgi:hypothetical protein